MDTTTISHDGAAPDAHLLPAETRVLGMAVKVWDLPTRLFHWSLVSCCTGAVVTAQLGGNWMDWHLRFGVATLGLLVFRVLWGLIGPRYARFTSFHASPHAVLAYLRKGSRHAGHSPTGALAVCAMLGLLLLQAGTGLFTSDSIATEGPWVHLASDELISWASWLHERTQWVLYGMVGLHIAAVLIYLLFKREDLITPMINGNKRGIHATPAADGKVVRLVGLMLIGGSVGLALWWLR